MTVAGIYLCLFIAFKLANIIDWSWWWVLSPLWIPFAIVLLIALIGYIFGSKK